MSFFVNSDTVIMFFAYFIACFITIFEKNFFILYIIGLKVLAFIVGNFKIMRSWIVTIYGFLYNIGTLKCVKCTKSKLYLFKKLGNSSCSFKLYHLKLAIILLKF